ncbi:MAG: glycine betaine catabolism [Actinomycetota bacterium]|nr:glycine betaine catabolism [Actinomycetota bacterium]
MRAGTRAPGRWTAGRPPDYLDCVFSQLADHGEPAPVARARVLPALAPLGTSRMLPREAYVDPAVFAWERRHFFGGWVCAGRSSDVAVAGDQRAVSLGDSGVLLTRAEDGRLRAFANVCRHRGHELLPCGTSANKRAIVCPYHAWTYRLDGSLQVAPSFEHVPGFDASPHGLGELPVREWHGWVFVDRSGTAQPFDQQVGTLAEIVAPYAPGDLQTLVRHEYEVAANWKVIVENYQECYHCSMIHPELCRVSPPESGANLDLPGDWVGGWMELRPDATTMSLDGSSAGVAIAGLAERELRTVMYVAVFPNLLVSLHPDYVMTHLLTPVDVDRTLVECAWAFPAQQPGLDPAYAVDFWDLTNRQDWAACESVQRGLASEHHVAGPLAPEEDGVYHFVSRVARGYLGLTADDDPPTA